MTSVSAKPYVPADQVTVDGVTYEVAEPRSVIDIDADMLWHGGTCAMESWFAVSNLESGGERIGLQVHFLIQSLPNGMDVVQLNAVVVNESAGVSRAFEHVYSLDQVEMSKDRLHLKTADLEVSADRHGFTWKARGDQAQIDISATAAAPPVMLNGEGQITFIDTKEQYDFGMPAMPTTGTVVIDSRTYQVTGHSWFDRQWGALPAFFSELLSGAEMPKDNKWMNWLWCNPQLDNGINISVCYLRDIRGGKIYLTLTAVQPDGTHIVVPKMQATELSEYWTSPVTGRRYPTRAVVRAPQIDTELTVEVSYKDQEIVSSMEVMTKYEGAATVTGTYQGKPVAGYAYLELVGNW
jgi:predicted secreted hydrolase